MEENLLLSFLFLHTASLPVSKKKTAPPNQANFQGSLSKTPGSLQREIFRVLLLKGSFDIAVPSSFWSSNPRITQWNYYSASIYKKK